MRVLGRTGIVTIVVLLATWAVAADQQIAGQRMTVLDPPPGATGRRSVVVRGRGPDGVTIVGDPVAGGATLRIIVKGQQVSDQTYSLPPAFWTTVADGYRFKGSGSSHGHKKVAIRTLAGAPRLMVAFRKPSDVLHVRPPQAPDAEGGIILTLAGGDSYCVSFGGAAGGTVMSDTAARWLVVGSQATGCVTPPPPRCCMHPGIPTNTCDWNASTVACEDPGGVAGAVGTVCDSATGNCVQPPGSAGPCCDVGGGSCFAGPSYQFSCPVGTLVTGVCEPSGSCTP